MRGLACSSDRTVSVPFPSCGKTAWDYFRRMEKIGEGTFSQVFLAEMERTTMFGQPRKAAVKVLHPFSSPERILTEVEFLRLLGGKENVVALLRAFRQCDNVMLVLDYLDHEEFKEHFLFYTIDDVRMYVYELLTALRHVHKHNVVHRDIKPSNFLANTKTGRFGLIDFGLAHVQEHFPETDLLVDMKLKRVRLDSSSSSSFFANSATGTSPPVSAISSLFSGSASGSSSVFTKNTGNAAILQSAKGIATAASTKRPVSAHRMAVSNRSSDAEGSLLDVRPSCKAPRMGTRGFRPPEVLFRVERLHTTKIDIWAVGVILLSIVTAKYPFFVAPDDHTNLCEIHALIGTDKLRKAAEEMGVDFRSSDSFPSHSWKHIVSDLRKHVRETPLTHAEALNDDLLNLLARMLECNPLRRISAEEALLHPFFTPYLVSGIQSLDRNAEATSEHDARAVDF
eukprot:ANDGO_03203.mRNA.1 putative cell division control protein 7 homolog 1